VQTCDFVSTLLMTLDGTIGNFAFANNQMESQLHQLLYYILFAVIMVVLVLNLLIAVMTSAYQKVFKDVRANWAHEQLCAIAGHAEGEAKPEWRRDLCGVSLPCWIWTPNWHRMVSRWLTAPSGLSLKADCCISESDCIRSEDADDYEFTLLQEKRYRLLRSAQQQKARADSGRSSQEGARSPTHLCCGKRDKESSGDEATDAQPLAAAPASSAAAAESETCCPAFQSQSADDPRRDAVLHGHDRFLSAAMNMDSTAGNLYSFDPTTQTLTLKYKESSSEVGLMTAETQVRLSQTDADEQRFETELDTTPIVIDAINFAGTLKVRHRTWLPGILQPTRHVHLVGEFMYDPAGITGDAHASEVVGEACSIAQIAVTSAQLAVLMRGGGPKELDAIEQAARPIMMTFHGRLALSEYMVYQMEEACIHNRQPLSYPEFILRLHRNGRIDLFDMEGEGREHSKLYFESYKQGNPVPPPQYFKKLKQKTAGCAVDIILDADNAA